MLKLRYEIKKQNKFEKLCKKLKKKVEKLSNASESLEDLVAKLFSNNDDYLFSYIDSAMASIAELPNNRKTRKIASLLKKMQNIVSDDIPEEEA